MMSKTRIVHETNRNLSGYVVIILFFVCTVKSEHARDGKNYKMKSYEPMMIDKSHGQKLIAVLL